MRTSHYQCRPVEMYLSDRAVQDLGFELYQIYY